jgi:hypothetical protein
MNKKFFGVIGVVLAMALIFAIPAMACQGNECSGTTEVNGHYEGNAHDYSISSSARGNESAVGEAGGNAGGVLDTYGSAENTYQNIYDNVLVSKEYRKWIPGHWEHQGNHKWYVNGYYTYKTFPLNTNTQGWEFVGNNYELQVVGRELVPGNASQEGFLKGEAEAKTWSHIRDYGQTSTSEAGAKFEGSVISKGTAIGEEGCREYVNSDLTVSGSVYQGNAANETGYDAGGVGGGNESGASFVASDKDAVSGNGYASDFNKVTGSAITEGKTKVSIDPTGNHRSFSGETGNYASVKETSDLQSASVYGNGGINGVISNGGSYAAGSVDFSYTGNTFGTGQGELSGSVDQNSHGSTVTIRGSSSATSN